MSVLDQIHKFAASLYRDTGSGINSIELTSKAFDLLKAELHNIYHSNTPPTNSTVSELIVATPLGRIAVRCVDFSTRFTAGNGLLNGNWIVPPGLTPLIPPAVLNCTHQWVDIGVMHPKLICKLCDADKE